MKTKPIIFLLIIFPSITFSQNDTLARLFRNSYKVFELQRNHVGVYRDSKVFSGADFHPSSVANIGMGLISLCIGDAMAWEENAEELVLTTLQRIAGNTPGFSPDRNASGYFRHFIDMETGRRAWNSEYSTIDTGILLSGALFCKNYFDNEDISFYAELLWNSIDFSKAIADPTNGSIFLTMGDDGNGIPGSITLPYNEYMIVAWLAHNQDNSLNSPASILWENHYSSPNNLPTSNYDGIPVLTDRPPSFLSSFTHQFNYFLCNYYTTSQAYLASFDHARKADSSWWANETLSEPYEWGNGAGSYDKGFGYNADKIGNNPSTIVSPHIIAGFLPVYPGGKFDLIKLLENNKGIYTLPSTPSDAVLWRYSLDNPSWRANEIQGIDHSTMLLGLASLPEFLGTDFFSRNNDFFQLGTSIQEPIERTFKVYPNPAKDVIFVDVSKDPDTAVFLIYDLKGNEIKSFSSSNQDTVKISVLDIPDGTYFIKNTRKNEVRKLLIMRD